MFVTYFPNFKSSMNPQFFLKHSRIFLLRKNVIKAVHFHKKRHFESLLKENKIIFREKNVKFVDLEFMKICCKQGPLKILNDQDSDSCRINMKSSKYLVKNCFQKHCILDSVIFIATFCPKTPGSTPGHFEPVLLPQISVKVKMMTKNFAS